MAKTKTGPSASRANLIALLVAERLTGQCVETYQNAAMQRGIDLEGEARDHYSFESGYAVQECGFIPAPDMARVGASPDGLVNDDGLLEVKCPSAMAKHLEALLRGAHAVEYAWQVQHQMMVTGRQWVDVVSYDPRWPEAHKMAVRRVARDEKAIQELRDEITKAEAEVQAIIDELNKRSNA